MANVTQVWPYSCVPAQEIHTLGTAGAAEHGVWDGGTLIRIMDESGDAHGLQEIKVSTARLDHYLPKRTAHLVCLSTSIDHMSEWWVALAHVLEIVPHCGSQNSKESQSTLGTWSLNREHLFIPGGNHEPKPMNPYCLILASVEEAAESPTPQVVKNGPGGRKKCWLWRRNGLNSSGKAINTFVL